MEQNESVKRMESTFVRSISAEVGNYYGTVELCEYKDANNNTDYYLSLDNWDRVSYKIVSNEFAMAFLKEFEPELIVDLTKSND